MDVHSQYLTAVEELVRAEEVVFNDLLRRGEALAGQAETASVLDRKGETPTS